MNSNRWHKAQRMCVTCRMIDGGPQAADDERGVCPISGAQEFNGAGKVKRRGQGVDLAGYRT